MKPSPSPNKRARISSVQNCPQWKTCKRYVASLGISDKYFDSDGDWCFCRSCVAERKEENCTKYLRGKKPHDVYSPPLGWSRFGLKISTANKETVLKEWNVSFHGCNAHSVSSIIEHEELLLPGDILKDGTKLSIRPGHIPNENFFFTSPTINYSLLETYATSVQWEGCRVKTVLQLRQAPGTFIVQDETVGWRKNHKETAIDPNFRNSEVEWKSNRRKTTVLTGLLVRYCNESKFLTAKDKAKASVCEARKKFAEAQRIVAQKREELAKLEIAERKASETLDKAEREFKILKVQLSNTASALRVFTHLINNGDYKEKGRNNDKKQKSPSSKESPTIAIQFFFML